MLEFIQSFSNLFESYPEVFSFLGASTVGDPGVILAAFLAASTSFTFFGVFLWALLGTVLADVFWYYVPSTRVYRFVVNLRAFKHWHDRLEAFLRNMPQKRDVFVMVLSKALAGTRVMMIVALSLHGMRFRRFIVVDVVINIIWTALLVFIGYLAQSSFETTLNYFQNTQLALLVLFVFFVVLVYISKKVTQYAYKKAPSSEDASKISMNKDRSKKERNQENFNTSKDENSQ